jgi:hypothetical protein
VTPPQQVHAELRRWGVRHLIVWSQAAVRFFDADRSFARRWASGPWVHFEYLDADGRDVVATSGRGRIVDRTMLGGQVELEDVRAGDRVVLRTHFHPEWSAWLDDDVAVPLETRDGQMAFDAPRDGSYVVTLRYPRRTWLLVLALIAVMIGATTTRGRWLASFNQP